MKSQTVRYDRMWIKITKPTNKRFEFAIGYNGNTKSFQSQVWPTHCVPTWEDAVILAENKLKNW